MEKKYWIRVNDKNAGPFSLDEIVKSNYSDETFFWKEGSENWNQLKNDHDFKKIKEKKKLQTKRKQYYLTYLFFLIIGLIIFIVTKSFINKSASKLKYDYGDDWYFQSIIENFDFLLILNFISIYLITLFIFLFISIKKKGIYIITIIVTLLFGAIFIINVNSINYLLNKLGEKDLPGINEMNKKSEKILNDLHSELNNINNNSVNQQSSIKKETEIIIEQNSTTIMTPEMLFEQWERNLIDKGIFDYVTKKDCENLDKMMNLYSKGKYPMHTESLSIIPFDFNDDKIKDYLINYSLQNCVEGNGWDTDFIFMTSQNGNLSINESLTNKLKSKIKNYVTKYFGSDSYVRVEKNYTIVTTFKINRISNNICYGNFYLLQNGAMCCPEISGNFEYNIEKNNFSVYNLKNNDL